jgi:DNA-3-methyladenine glycosylase I
MAKKAIVAAARCPWARTELLATYHDTEWGVPVHDDRTHFEFLILEAAQAGLNWETVLKKRQGYRGAFADFDPLVVAKYGKKERSRLLKNSGIIRNRLKIESAISNAQLFLDVQAEFGSFDAFVWQFVEHVPRQNAWKDLKHVPPRTADSDRLSKELKRRGFRFVGSTICYAYMQAIGMVNDHLVTCFRHRELVG